MTEDRYNRKSHMDALSIGYQSMTLNDRNAPIYQISLLSRARYVQLNEYIVSGKS